MSTPRVLAILGSGETAPVMTSVHAELLRRLGHGALAVMLDTPYGFQENADEISVRSANYFAHNVGHPIEVLTYRKADVAGVGAYERMCAGLATAEYVFAGPGSPTYALRQWRGTRVPELLAGKLRRGGIVSFASAAAVGLGELALPVYEIYKVGEPARWEPGLDILATTGIRAAVIPHYNNAEGGTHDTRYCYMGERRLRALEAMLPQGCSILGVDEHTACLIDLDAAAFVVRGAGAVTWRSGGFERVWRAGEGSLLTELVEMAGAPTGAAAPGTLNVAPVVADTDVEALRQRALGALRRREVDEAVDVMLALDSAAVDAGAPPVRGAAAQAALRELLIHLASLAHTGAADPRRRLAPLVGALLDVRDRARAERRFADADALRETLAEAGVQVHDTPGGSSWDLEEETARN